MLLKKYKHFDKIVNNRHDQSNILFSQLFMKYCQHQQQPQQPNLRHRSSTYSFIMVLGVMSMMLLLLPLGCVDAVGYSYTRFVGPVAGPEHKIYVNDANAAADGKTHQLGSGGTPRLDYVAKAEYQFAYGVEDADAHILHNRNEVRDGDVVKGVYSLIDPDGALRVVKYTADDINGFQAEVIRNGVSSLHGQLQNDYKRAPPLEISHNYDNPDYEQHHYPQSQTHLKVNTNKYYPSSNMYGPNLEQLQKINHQLYNPPNYYQTPPHPPIIYHYNSNNNNNDADVDDSNSDSDYRDDQQPQYEVHEKPNNNDHKNQKDDDCERDDHKSNNDDNAVDYKNQKHHPGKYDDDDDDYDDEDDSEELEDYDEAVHNNKNSEESDEYY